MALSTTALSEAKAKFEAAQSAAAWEVGEQLTRDALRAAEEALVAARRGGDAEARLSALELVVQANMYLGDMFAASLAATDELAMIQRTGNKQAEAKALQLLADVRTARADGAGAAESLQSVVALLRDLGDKAGQAKALLQLAEAKLSVGKKNEALAPAEEALQLAVELGGEGSGEGGTQAARRTLSLVYAEKGQLDKAPGRPEALLALKGLSEAVDSRDASAWKAAMEELDRTGAYTRKDIDDTISTALEKDRTGAAAFLEELDIVVEGTGKPQLQIHEILKTLNYISMRLGGLAYGPRFRCLTSFRKQVTGDPTSLGALACLQVSDEADDWEVDLQYHPGVLDGLLQSVGATAYEPWR